MTVLGLKLSRRANAVSALHGHVSRRMWAHLWPWRVEEEIPIGHITNGVHVPSWLPGRCCSFTTVTFQSAGSSGWASSTLAADPPCGSGRTVGVHYALKNLCLHLCARRVSRQCRRRGESDAIVEASRNLLDPNILTIGFARRFATYKRADLIMSDVERLFQLVNDSDRPIQLIFAGKAHPARRAGQAVDQEDRQQPARRKVCQPGRVRRDYDINVCRHLVQGVDVWLNNPRRPLEASGTSGQKAVLNGGLNLSVLDGWWGEAYDGINGFAIGKATQHVSDQITDQRDGDSLYDVLENEVIPLFYERDVDGLPRGWIQRMMNSISSLAGGLVLIAW